MTAPASLALFAPCDYCGEAAALPAPGAPHTAYCPACQTRQAKEEAARAMLEDMGGPVLGAWASFWLRAGLTVPQLEAVLSLFDMSWANSDYAQRVRLLSLRRLARAHPLPPVEAVTVPPQRVGVDFAALPLLTAFCPEDPTPGAWGEPAFFDSAGHRARLLPGVDTLALTLQGGVRAVLYTGQEGSGPYKPSFPSEPVGLRVPPELWPAFEVYMSGREKWADLPGEVIRAKLPAPAAPVPALPVLIACRTEAGRAVLLVDRAGQVFQHAAPPAVPPQPDRWPAWASADPVPGRPDPRRFLRGLARRAAHRAGCLLFAAGGQRVTRARSRRVRPIFPGAARLEACEVLRSGAGVPALFLRTLTADSRAGLFRLPEDVGVTFQTGEGKKGAAGVRAVFSSPDTAQLLDLSEAAYAGLLEGLACLLEARQEVGAAGPSEDLPGKGHTLKCAAVIFEEGQRPALYVGTAGPDFAARVYRVPEGVRVSLEAPSPLPAEVDKRGRAAVLKGRCLLEGPQGSAALSVSTVSTARALLGVLEAFGQARAVWEGPHSFHPGEEKTAGQGAA